MPNLIPIDKTLSIDISIHITIAKLAEFGYPAIPVAPKQDPHRYPKRVAGKIIYEKDGVTPEAQFTGKNPSYLLANGKPQYLDHNKYQEVLPTSAEIALWFANPATGIGTLGGYNGSVWLDFDRKGTIDLDVRFEAWLTAYPHLRDAWTEVTHSGGYRVLVSCPKPDFTNFKLDPSGPQVGEAIGYGRFTVLAPTIGVSGNPYRCINEGGAIAVDSLADIGILSTKKTRSKKAQATIPTTIPSTEPPLYPTVVVSDSNIANLEPIALELLLSRKTKGVISGDTTGYTSASEAFTALLHELHGWHNWAMKHRVPLSGNVHSISSIAAVALGYDDDKRDRVAKSANWADSIPGVSGKVGDIGCWQIIRRVSPTIFELLCPVDIRDARVLECALRRLPLPLTEVRTKNNVTYKLPTEVETARYVNVFYTGTFALHEEEQIFYRYSENGGFWEALNDTELDRIIAHVIANTDRGDAYDKCGPNYIGNTRKHLHLEAAPTPPPADKNIIPFKGKWFDTIAKTWVKPNPSVFINAPLPIAPEAGDFSRISDWLMVASGSDPGNYDLLRCLFWLILHGDTSRQVYYEIIGLAGTGKGSLVNLLQNMVGFSNQVSTSIAALDKTQFETATLLGKRLIVMPDQKRYSGSCDNIKRITGGDSLRFERKNNANISNFKASGILVVTGNDFLKFDDEADALERRRIPIKFDIKVSEETKAAQHNFDGFLAAALPQWVDHILSIDTDWIYQIISRRRELTAAARLEQLLSANPISQWLDACTLVVPNAQTPIGNADSYGGLYASYVGYCRTNGANPVGSNKWSTDLKKLLHTLNWSESAISFKKTNKGSICCGLVIWESNLVGTNPITRQPNLTHTVAIDLETRVIF